MLHHKVNYHFFISLVLLITVFTNNIFAQSGEIHGKITDKANGEGIPFSNIIVMLNGVQGGGATTDFNGNYAIKPLSPGKYDVKVTYVGYQPAETKGVIVSADKASVVNIQLNAGVKLSEVEVTSYKVPLIDPGQTSTGATITQEQIAKLPTRNIQSMAALSSGVVQADAGHDIYIKGARSDANVYFIDGVKVTGANSTTEFGLQSGASSLPSSGVEQVTVITGGIPAKYGDVTGGVIEITTRGPSKNFASSGEFVTSRFLDPYRYNLVSTNLSGPIFMKNKGTAMERTALGFFIAGDYEWVKDGSPSANGAYVIKPEKKEELINQPLRIDEHGNILRSAEFITKNDLNHVKARPDVGSRDVKFTGKIDYVLNKNINLTFGGSYNYIYQRYALYEYSLFSSDKNPVHESDVWRVYGRMTHRLSKTKSGEDAKSSGSSIFQNAFYTFQIDYTKDRSKLYHPDHKDHFFDYGYLGKFTTYKKPNWDTTLQVLGPDSLYHNVWANTSDSTLVTFAPGGKNPVLENITLNYIKLLENPPETLDNLETPPGMINGTRVNIENQSAYGLYAMPGRFYNGYYKTDNDQMRVTLNGSFDIMPKGTTERNKHSIEVGLELETSAQRYFSITPIELWSLMRSETNNQLVNLDVDHPNWLTDVSDGIDVNDTAWLHRKYVASDQSFFDKSLRKKLGLAENDTTLIDIDNYSPEMFSLDMFSADELINNDYVSNYFGYDYTGKKLKKRSKFEDFWTEKDANGNYTRPQDAYRPIYAAGYIQDRFYFRDLNFNVGLRVDRFDAHQYVMKDPFSLYPIKTVADVQFINNKSVTHPSSVENDYFVYVDNITAPTKIVGYRNGDVWYDANGKRLINGDPLKAGGQVNPYLVNPHADIQSPDFKPTESLKKYPAAYTFMPRIAFSFPISDVAQFFAHYDVLSQRPLTISSTYNSIVPGNFATAADFYKMESRGYINNTALKPSRTIDYQIGFKQKVSRTSAFTVSGFYRELKDMIALFNYINAYPKSYETYGNVDFGTVKGLAFNYDLRRTNNFSLNANYTLQFADGTGSEPESQGTLVAAGRPNLKRTLPLDYDQRHVIVLALDYHYSEGSEYNGPKWFGKNILENFGVNVITRMASGFPYSRYNESWKISNSRPPALSGSPNSARLPWTFKMDLKLDKEFEIKFKKADGTKGSPLSITVYLLVENLWNTKNILNVHKFTGSPDDDGYLASPAGQLEISNKYPSASSFIDIYNVYINNPENYSLPRMTRMGITFNF